MKRDLPAPVSPVMVCIPDWKESSTVRNNRKLLARISRSILPPLSPEDFFCQGLPVGIGGGVRQKKAIRRNAESRV